MLAQGLEQGLEKGLEKGRREGEANLLLRQLVRRFGPLGSATTERVHQATAAELERWADNFVEARTLDEVFDLH